MTRYTSLYCSCWSNVQTLVLLPSFVPSVTAHIPSVLSPSVSPSHLLCFPTLTGSQLYPLLHTSTLRTLLTKKLTPLLLIQRHHPLRNHPLNFPLYCHPHHCFFFTIIISSFISELLPHSPIMPNPSYESILLPLSSSQSHHSPGPILQFNCNSIQHCLHEIS